VLADDPLLTCRLPGMAAYSPVRAVFDAKLHTPIASRLVQTVREVPLWVLTATEASPSAEGALVAKGVNVLRVASADGGIDLGAALKLLAERGITRLMVEGGPTLAAAFVTADLVDEATLFQSPKEAGPDGIDALEGLPLTALTQSPRLVSVSCRAMGTDMYEVFERR
jgi:diaminohydroxyphosphoribosylaminopyrimidine deaminase/5-amino-6-(5-phosphoribosylamino)uracil reductase